jgi:putative transposase
MPGRNIIKEYASDQYYHVYSRGVAKQQIFLDEDDYAAFLHLLKRYLSPGKSVSKARVTYPSYYGRAELSAFCLMSNHVHLLIYQTDEKALPELMRSVMTSYSMYFNRKYKRVGPVFQSRYRASRITSDSYLDHISRYIHLNPREWLEYPYSSLKYYLGKAEAEWVAPKKILDLFPSTDQYLEFVKDYEGYKDMLDEIHWELADQ